MSTPEWLVVDTAVVELTEASYGRGTGSLKVSAIAKIGKRDVVLANGSRYNVKRLSQNNGTRNPTYLLPIDDPAVVAMKTANKKERLTNRALVICDELKRAIKHDEGDCDLEEALDNVVVAMKVLLEQER